MELKIELEGTHSTFLELDISTVDDRFVYKLYDKRGNFDFFTVRMPQIPSSVFYGFVFNEFIRIARCII